MLLRTHICPNHCKKPEWQKRENERRVGYARMVIESHLIYKIGYSAPNNWDLALDYICPVCGKRIEVTWKDVRQESRAPKVHM